MFGVFFENMFAIWLCKISILHIDRRTHRSVKVNKCHFCHRHFRTVKEARNIHWINIKAASTSGIQILIEQLNENNREFSNFIGCCICIFRLRTKIKLKEFLAFRKNILKLMPINLNCQNSDIFLPKGSNPRRFFLLGHGKRNPKKFNFRKNKLHNLCKRCNISYIHKHILILLSWWDI